MEAIKNLIEIQKEQSFEIPIMTSFSKTLYENQRTFTLKQKRKNNSNVDNVVGIEEMEVFNPQDVGLPK